MTNGQPVVSGIIMAFVMLILGLAVFYLLQRYRSLERRCEQMDVQLQSTVTQEFFKSWVTRGGLREPPAQPAPEPIARHDDPASAVLLVNMMSGHTAFQPFQPFQPDMRMFADEQSADAPRVVDVTDEPAPYGGSSADAATTERSTGPMYSATDPELEPAPANLPPPLDPPACPSHPHEEATWGTSAEPSPWGPPAPDGVAVDMARVEFAAGSPTLAASDRQPYPDPSEPERRPTEECLVGGECPLIDTDPASDPMGTTTLSTGPAAATWAGDAPATGTLDAGASIVGEPTAYDAQPCARSPNPRSPARSPARPAARSSARAASHHHHPAERSPGIRRRRAQ